MQGQSAGNWKFLSGFHRISQVFSSLVIGDLEEFLDDWKVEDPSPSSDHSTFLGDEPTILELRLDVIGVHHGDEVDRHVLGAGLLTLTMVGA